MKTRRDLAVPMERITWRDGQLLTARDLRDDDQTNARLRHLHIHYLHRTWGVVEGLKVVLLGKDAVVGPGYALDVEGRELLLRRASAIAAPAGVSATIYLVISGSGSQPGQCGCATAPPVDLRTLCPGKANAAALIEGSLSWKTVTEVRPGLDILLARVLVAGGRFASEADTLVRRIAASMAQPRIWSDTTQAGQTGWSDVTGDEFAAIQARIDTSDAGFTQTPAYFTRVVSAPGPVTSYVSSANATGFTIVAREFQIAALREDTAAKPTLTAAAAEAGGVTIAWFATETMTDK